ncbi:hypothetical protein DTL21_17690 [Bremerella cremea]|uniref:Uncharacterized protein n=1 Tax=Blastopirellula marina TaxID=124 RepID=A0A2S8FJH1_9BACT|nr:MULTISPECIES: hypothetical protein [Pirellulaceae]PQO32074.1 hypothetical protein C5Y83_17675 [Blastopirellula marina]RCS45140.1 hypothetical protein DTL21_17690 [Bremerella cremea]
MGSDPLFEDDDQPEILEDEPQFSRPWRPRFGIATIMFATTLLSVVFVMGHLMLNGDDKGLLPKRFAFLFVTLAAPMIIVTILSIGREVLRFLQKQSARDRSRNSR